MRITLGAREKKERRIGERLGLKGDRCDGPKCAVVRRNAPPGAHGNARRRRLSGFALQLREKQKAQLIYGLSERQFRNYVAKAQSKRGDSALMLGSFLERRLDSVVYKLGFTRSRAEGRQTVSHGHFLVNGKKVDIPSYQVRPGDIIEIRGKSRQGKFFGEEIKPRLGKRESPKWLNLDIAEFRGKVLDHPDADDLPQNFDRKMIIEFYSR